MALGWLWGRNPLAINTLWGGLGVALAGLTRLFRNPHSGLAERFIVGATKPARPSTPEAETKAHRYDSPPRTAEQVAA